MKIISFEERVRNRVELETVTTDISNAGQEEIDDGYFPSAKDFLDCIGELVEIAQNKVWDLEREIVDLEELNTSEEWQFWESLNDDLRGEYSEYEEKLESAFPEEYDEEIRSKSL